MANEKNLAPPIQAGEEAREKGRKGGIESGKVRRQKKALQESALALMMAAVKDPDFRAIAESVGVKTRTSSGKQKTVTTQQVMMAALALKVINSGDHQAYLALLRTADPSIFRGGGTESTADGGDGTNGGSGVVVIPSRDADMTPPPDDGDGQINQ